MKNQRSELSTKNKYWIPKFRYLELKNYCLQYPDWKKELSQISVLQTHSQISTAGKFSDPTFAIVLKRERLQENISLIEDTATKADEFLAKWIVKGVTESLSYEFLHLQLNMPASRDTYYDRYRRFFWFLDQVR